MRQPAGNKAEEAEMGSRKRKKRRKKAKEAHEKIRSIHFRACLSGFREMGQERAGKGSTRSAAKGRERAGTNGGGLLAARDNKKTHLTLKRGFFQKKHGLIVGVHGNRG